MAKRVQVKGRYLPGEGSALRFFSTGCTPLDCVMGQGYPLGRIVNVVGNKSTGKTLLAIEGCANFARTFEDGRITYDETEQAFDVRYAESVGLPTDAVEFRQSATVEDLFGALLERVDDTTVPQLYVIDSLDALSDEAEMEREINKGSFGAAKAKKLSELFRRLNQRIARSNMTVLVVSQVRQRFNVAYGEPHQRAGGMALDFYATHCVWLKETGKIKTTSKGVSRITGVSVKATCKKNKVAEPFRDCTFPVVFNFGVDDLEACREWLRENKIKAIGLEKGVALVPGSPEWHKERERMARIVRDQYRKVEDRFKPAGRKYA